MIGKIVEIENNNLIVELSPDILLKGNILNLYVSIKDSNKTYVGEIIKVNRKEAYVSLIGEYQNNQFVFGVSSKPSFAAQVSLLPVNDVNSIIGINDINEKNSLYIGNSLIYQNVKIGAKINYLFGSHFAIFGTTGTGKSCGVARILQNLFEKKENIPYYSNIFVFDASGEYHTAFQSLPNQNPAINFKVYTTDVTDQNTELVRIPLWIMNIDDIAIMLGIDHAEQMPILEKALKFVTIFGREEEKVIKYKNSIIAKALRDILLSGRPAAQIRDQIFSVLTTYYTKELNLDTPVYQPGYTRPLKQCLLIDNSGKIQAMELLSNFLSGFILEKLELHIPDGSFPYTLEDLYTALNFALIDEGILKNEKVYELANVLIVRLKTLMDSDSGNYFRYPKFIAKDQYINELIMTPKGKAQIINFNINYVDDRFAKVITKIYARMLFEYAKNQPNRASIPFHIILEEAHRYVQNDSDTKILGYNIFDRIAKEGRKYAVLLGLITQRPSELSETVLSQCTNFLMFKMIHPLDVKFVYELVPNITEDIIEKVKTLQAGNCMTFGTAFKIPTIVKLAMPNPSPSSNSCDVSSVWFINQL